MNIPNEVWVEILKRCDPVTYIRLLSVSKCIPKDAKQYEHMKTQYYKIKNEIILLKAVKRNGYVEIPIANGFGNKIEFQTPQFTMSAVSLDRRNENPTYTIDFNLSALQGDPIYQNFVATLAKIDKFVSEKRESEK